MGIGLGVITGTYLKMLNPQNRQGPLLLKNLLVLSPINKETFNKKNHKIIPISRFTNKKFIFNQISQKKEIQTLSKRWKRLSSQHPDLIASGFMLILDNGMHAKLSPSTPLPAASSIKTPILLVTLQMLDKGLIEWNEQLTLTKEVIGGGAGWMALKPVGTTFPLHEVATEMIRVSDNTATNLLIKRIGGRDVLNQKLNTLGLNETVVNNWLPDLKGTNTTSAYDLTKSIALVDTGQVLSRRSRDLFREVMGSSKNNRLLPTGLLRGGLGNERSEPDYSLLIKGYRVYNKTGDIGISYADAGLIQLPNNKRAVAGFIVKGPFNDPRSPELIRNMAAAMVPNLRPTITSPNSFQIKKE